MQDSNNYRPISLLSNLSTLIEKLIHKRLYSFLHQNDYLFTYQFAFCNHHSTNHALISIKEKIRKNLDEGKFACSVFLGFQKAFDTVNHAILLAKLQHYGVKGVPVNWFKSYLEDCTQYTEVNNTSSQIIPIKNVVAQGSVLGPLLFLIYVNDLHNVVQYSDINHFADYSNCLHSSKSLKDITKKVNFELKDIVHWLRANRISLNTSKTL